MTAPRLFALALMSILTMLTPLQASAQRQAGRARGGPPGQERALEAEIQQRLSEIVRQRLELNDAQMARLAQTNQRFESRRRELLRAERGVRMALRDEVLAGDSANQGQVSELLDRMLRIQRQRLDLLEAEQRELAQFLTPVQRARYFAIQDEFRRRAEEIRRRRIPGMPGGSGAPGQRPPRGRPN